MAIYLCVHFWKQRNRTRPPEASNSGLHSIGVNTDLPNPQESPIISCHIVRLSYHFAHYAQPTQNPQHPHAASCSCVSRFWLETLGVSLKHQTFKSLGQKSSHVQTSSKVTRPVTGQAFKHTKTAVWVDENDCLPPGTWSCDSCNCDSFRRRAWKSDAHAFQQWHPTRRTVFPKSTK